MANVYKPFLLQIRPQYSGGDVDFPENVLWFTGSVEEGYTITQLLAIQAEFDTFWSDVWKIGGSDDAHYTSCFVTDWTSNEGLQAIPVADVAIPGTGGSNLAPANVAILISQTVAVRYRGGHPRIYLPCLAQNVNNSATTIGSGLVAEIVTALSNFQIAMNGIDADLGGPVDWAVYRFRNDPAKATVLSPTSQIVQSTLASQRRRLRKAAHR